MSLLDLERKQVTRTHMDRLLRPRSIAIIGASSTPGSLGESVLLNLERAVYNGELYLINPKRPTIHGRECLGSIAELPEGVDCALLSIPGTSVLSSLSACAAKRIATAIVFSAGFAEAGDGGKLAQNEVARIAREHEMLVEGPNCLGMVNYIDGIPLTFVVTPPQEKIDCAGAAILSQSGALAAVIAVNMRHHAIPLSYSVSTGNEAVTGIEDFLEYLLDDVSTRVFALVVEQFREPRRFLELAMRAHEAGKFIVLLHPGRSGAARASAATHTGAIAGDYAVMHTMVTHAGVIHVETLEELVDVVQILVRCPVMPRGGAAVFTESGAFKAHTLDLCDSVGLELPQLSQRCDDALREALPPFIPPSNPLDLTAQGLVDPDLYRRTLPPILDDDEFGSVVLGIILTDPKTTQLKLPPIVTAIKALKPSKPVVFAALDEGAPFDFPELAELRSLGVACLPSTERALRALAHVTRRAMHRQSRDRDRAACAELPLLHTGLLSEFESKQILAQIGVRHPDGGVARTPEDAARIANEIGYPVVLKAHSAELAHKSDVGGVLLGIDSDAALGEAWLTLHQNVSNAQPELVLQGVLVERMSEKGLELIVGAKRDPQWGPVVMAGFGGVLAELLQDVRLMPADLDRDGIELELAQLRCSAIFQGFRGAPAYDLAAATSVIEKVSCLMRAYPEIAEIDINPLVVYENGKGAMALDALISIEHQPIGSNER